MNNGTQKYRAAIVGCGRIGFGFDQDPKRKYIATHSGAYSVVKGACLAAVCDADTQKLNACKKKYPDLNAYTDIKEMLAREKIHLLSLCTPVQTHNSLLKEALLFPIKAIFCEKPLAGTIPEAEEMVRLCRDKGVILQVDHQRRFDPMHIRIREEIAKGTFGEPYQVNFYYTAGIHNTGSHMFDLLRFFFGDIQWVAGTFSKSPSIKKEDPNVDGILKFKSGLTGTFQACDVNKYLIFEMRAFFEKGMLELKHSGFSLEYYTPSESSYFSGYKELVRGRISWPVKYKRNFMVRGVEHLIDCLKKETRSLSSGEDGLAALKLINAAIESAENNNKKVMIKECHE
ncbi:MAG: Gfo/Idh/MocA family oxidoreductase [Candidatus Omnitrophota bacterium]